MTHTLTVLNNELFPPLVGGAAIMLLAFGVVMVRTRVLPKWLGWLSILIAVLLLTPVGFFALLAMIIWVAGLGILLFLRGEDVTHPD